MERSDYLSRALGVVVELHFIGWRRTTHLERLLWIAASMSAVCGIAMFLPSRGVGLDGDE